MAAVTAMVVHEAAAARDATDDADISDARLDLLLLLLLLLLDEDDELLRVR